MNGLPDLRAGVYRHYKGPLYQVFGYAHDANAENLSTWGVDHHGDLNPLGERIGVVYMSLELTDAHTGPRLAFRNVEGADAFYDDVHMGNPERFAEGTVCEGSCKYNRINGDGTGLPHNVVPRFTYLGPTWEG